MQNQDAIRHLHLFLEERAPFLKEGCSLLRGTCFLVLNKKIPEWKALCEGAFFSVSKETEHLAYFDISSINNPSFFCVEDRLFVSQALQKVSGSDYVSSYIRALLRSPGSFAQENALLTPWHLELCLRICVAQILKSHLTLRPVPVLMLVLIRSLQGRFLPPKSMLCALLSAIQGHELSEAPKELFKLGRHCLWEGEGSF